MTLLSQYHQVSQGTVVPQVRCSSCDMHVTLLIGSFDYEEDEYIAADLVKVLACYILACFIFY